MAVVCNPYYLMEVPFTSIYPNFSDLSSNQSKTNKHTDNIAVSNPDFAVAPSAPQLPNTRHELLAWFLCDQYPEALAPELISQLESQWFKITGHPFILYDNNECDLITIITDLQYREYGLTIIYKNRQPVDRTEMMKLHEQFFSEFECRISDFFTNESFKHLVDSVLAERLV